MVDRRSPLLLTRAAVHELLKKVGALTATGSLLGLDVMNRGLFFSLVAWPRQAALAWRGAPGRFGTNDPEKLMARHGFEADVRQPGEEGANFGRWFRPMLPREVPGLPRSFLVRAPLASDRERVRALLLLRAASGTPGYYRLKKHWASRGDWER